ncbi:hypothetical protein P280DRAFT_484060 [Massarina eburnea CBS 473.64]|uniref:Uncharacterized protein n=1 Tax=Massarina eburnea CBS 473.64 TaxID=1395130 RepID=A0A6A6RLW2_9PLEO|nr:hypothetical protein P280DRAFT_484060 [Massarina eburnea CBS 473.64]
MYTYIYMWSSSRLQVNPTGSRDFLVNPLIVRQTIRHHNIHRAVGTRIRGTNTAVNVGFATYDTPNTPISNTRNPQTPPPFIFLCSSFRDQRVALHLSFRMHHILGKRSRENWSFGFASLRAGQLSDRYWHSLQTRYTTGIIFEQLRDTLLGSILVGFRAAVLEKQHGARLDPLLCISPAILRVEGPRPYDAGNIGRA